MGALLEHSHEVEFNVLFKAYTENYSLVEPTVFSPCKASTIIMNLFGEGGVNLSGAKYCKTRMPSWGERNDDC